MYVRLGYSLRKDKITANKLRSQLEVLWGDLLDLKSGRVESLSNRPFECCIMEYGVPVQPADGTSRKWVRCHKIFDTSIRGFDHGDDGR